MNHNYHFYVLLLLVLFCKIAAGQSNGNDFVNQLKNHNTTPFSNFKGSFNVNDNGSASYTIPIFTTPGVAGMSPKISLAYNSANESSLLGEGWALSGLSYIGRDPQIKAIDNNVMSVHFDSNDKLQIDGQRLVPENEDMIYGSTGSGYRTENDGFSKIVIGQGSDDINEIKNFVVSGKDGLKYSYGNAADVDNAIVSTADGYPILWLVKRVEDMNHNWISFDYNISAGTYTPAKISWGSKDNLTTPVGYILFETKADPARSWSEERYVNGEKIAIGNLISRISSYYVDYANNNNPVLVKSYNLEYFHNPDSKKSFITNIYELSKDQSVRNRLYSKANSISFGYNFNNDLSNVFQPGIRMKEPIRLDEDYKFVLGDFNGDGFPDKIYTKVYLDHIDVYVNLNNRKGTFSSLSQHFSVQKSIDVKAKLYCADFNGDGMSDLLFAYYNGDRLNAFLIHPLTDKKYVLTNIDTLSLNLWTKDSAVNASDVKIQSGDLNSDGIADLFLYYFKGNDFHYNPITFSKDFSIARYPDFPIPSAFDFSGTLKPGDIATFFTDLNGDGIYDFLFSWTDATGWKVKTYLFKDASLAGTPSVTSPVSPMTNAKAFINPDFLTYTVTDPVTRAPVEKDVTLTSEDFSKLKNIMIADVNNDGNADLIISNTSKDGWKCYVAIGKGNGDFIFSGPQVLNQTAYNYNYRAAFGDFNGDKNTDLIIQNSDETGWHTLIAYGDGKGSFKLRDNAGTINTIANANFSYRTAFKCENLICINIFTQYVDGYRNIVNQFGDQSRLNPYPACYDGNGALTTDPGQLATCHNVSDMAFLIGQLRKYRIVETGSYPNQTIDPFPNILNDCYNDLYKQSLDYDNNLKRVSDIQGFSTQTSPHSIIRQTDDNGSTEQIDFPFQTYAFFDYIDYWQPYVVDLNGDGISDLMLTYTRQPENSAVTGVPANDLENSVNTFISLNKCSYEGKLNSVSHADQNNIHITYQSVLADDSNPFTAIPTSYPLIKANLAINVVRNTLINNNVNKDSLTRTSYHFFDGIIGLNGRGFLGFSKIGIVNESTGATAEKTFFTTADYLNYGAMPLQSSKVYVPGTMTPTEEENYSYVLKRAEGVHFYHLFMAGNEKISRDLNGVILGKKKSTMEYDDFGNVISNVFENGISGDSYISQTTTSNYYDNDQDNYWREHWILGRLKTARVKTVFQGTMDESKISSFEYSRTNGQLTRETLSAADPGLSFSKTYELDGFGNIVSSSIYPVSDPAAVKKTVTSYTPDHRFVSQKQDPEGYLTNYSYNNLTGDIRTIGAGGDGTKTIMDGDIYGWVKKVKNEDNSATVSSLFLCSNCNCPDAAYFSLAENTGKPSVVTFFNNSGKTVRTVTFDFKNNVLITDYRYDVYNNIVLKSNPYLQGQTPFYTTYQFDAINRMTSLRMPDQSGINYAYNGLTETITDAMARKTILETNVLSQKVLVRDADNFTIKYTYDMFGNVISIADKNGIEITKKYDANGNVAEYFNPNFNKPYLTYYNCYNKLIRETDPNGNTKAFSYDKDDRIIQESVWKKNSADTNKTTYEYLPQNTADGIYGRSRLHKVSSSGEDNLINQEFIYDKFNRISSVIYTYAEGFLTNPNFSKNKVFRYDYSYQDNGLIRQIHYPYNPLLVNNKHDKIKTDRDLSVNYSYANNILSRVSVEVAGQPDINAWTLNETGSAGNVKNYSLGNGISCAYTYSDEMDYLKSIAYSKGGHTLAGMNYDYDLSGNITRTTDSSDPALTEGIGYDQLNRITSVKTPGTDVTVEYNDNGDLKLKSYNNDTIRFRYAANSNKLSEITYDAGNRSWNADQAYDNGGNLLSNLNLMTSKTTRVEYNDRNLPERVGDISYHYGFANERQVEDYGDELDVYLSGLSEMIYRKDTRSCGSELNFPWIDKKYGFCTQRFNILVNNQVIGYVNSSDASITYYLYDLDNNIIGTTDRDGNVLEKYAYDPWGRKKDGNTWKYYTDETTASNSYEKGYNQNISLDDQGLVNFTSRLYDPVSGRFTGVDAKLSDNLSFTQFTNAYAYGYNNPFKFSDANGKFPWLIMAVVAYFGASEAGGSLMPWHWNDNWWKGALTGAAAVAGGELAGPVFATGSGATYSISYATGAGFGNAFTGAFVNTIVNGGNFGQALSSGLSNGGIGGLAGSVTAYIGHGVSGWENPEPLSENYFLKAGAHGISQGAFSNLLGGSFLHGFLSASATSLIQPVYTSEYFLNSSADERVVYSSLLGGSLSEIGGGKFSNGAVSAAFVQLYNDENTKETLEKIQTNIDAGTSAAKTIWDATGASISRNMEIYDDWYSPAFSAGFAAYDFVVNKADPAMLVTCNMYGILVTSVTSASPLTPVGGFILGMTAEKACEYVWPTTNLINPAY